MYITCPNCQAVHSTSLDYTSPANAAKDALDWARDHESGYCVQPKHYFTVEADDFQEVASLVSPAHRLSVAPAASGCAVGVIEVAADTPDAAAAAAAAECEALAARGVNAAVHATRDDAAAYAFTRVGRH